MIIFSYILAAILLFLYIPEIIFEYLGYENRFVTKFTFWGCWILIGVSIYGFCKVLKYIYCSAMQGLKGKHENIKTMSKKTVPITYIYIIIFIGALLIIYGVNHPYEENTYFIQPT